ncbi:MAG: hypothetical protein IIA59_06495 [Candidatus Marinimicrobia bacterium]|nr:hypothetical protein [Candidatus Neomarinimicrobiota bacterium]
MPRFRWALVLMAFGLWGCEDNAEIIGTVRDIDDGSAISGVAVGFGQDLDGKFTVRNEFTATTGSLGGYLLSTEVGPFPSGFVLFSHAVYHPDTVDFFGAEVGRRKRVDVNLVPLPGTDTTASAAVKPGP